MRLLSIAVILIAGRVCTAAEADRRLAAPVSASWSGVGLRQALTGLTQIGGLPFILDRRVDPDAPLTASFTMTPLGDAYRELAELRGTRYVAIGPVVYLGPRADEVTTLATLRSDEARKLSSKVAAIYLARKTWQWDDLATPRELLARLANEAGAKVSGIERVPHDLWGGANLPPTTLIERLTLVAVQFDLTFRLADDGRTIALEPLPASLPTTAPNVARSKPTTTPTAPRGKQVHTLKVDNVPLERLLEALTTKMGLTLNLDRAAIVAAGIKLDQLASLHVMQVTTEQLYQQLLEPLGLSSRLDGTTLYVGVKSPGR
ncbi:MAG TPA: hypothetical protein VG713_15135 [Pirellulales bacterium]|nr:hypothetical protein [Pirellulales bacterium]